MALFHCENCNLTKTVPDKFAGKKVRCPKCKADTVVNAEKSLEEIAVKASVAPDDVGDAMFQCEDCGHTEPASADSIGEERRCVRCGGVGSVEEFEPGDHVPSEEDVNLSDLAEDFAEDAPEQNQNPKGSLLGAMPSMGTPSAVREILEEERKGKVSFLQGGLFCNLVAGLGSGLLGALACIALAALVYPEGWQSGHYGPILAALLTATIAGGLLSTFRSAIHFGITAPDPSSALVLSFLVGGVVTAMPEAQPESIAATALAVSMAFSLGMGIVAWLTWASGNGNWTRYLPVQILGGVPAALGIFVIGGAMTFLMGGTPDYATLLGGLGQIGMGQAPETVWMWLPAVLFGIFLQVFFRRYHHPLLLVLAVGLACGLPHWLAYAGIDLPAPIGAEGFRLAYDFEPGRIAAIYSSDFLSLVDWRVLESLKVELAAGVILLLSIAMYKITRVENELNRELDLGRELRVLGSDNALSALLGGTPLTFCLGRSLGNLRGGARGSFSLLVSALVPVALLVYGGLALPFVPTYVVGGVLVFFGLNLLIRWLISSRKEFFRADDYALLVITFGVTLFGGLVLGVGTGLALAMIVSVTRYGSGGVVRQMLSGANHRSHVDRAPTQLDYLKQHGGGIIVVRLQGFVTVGALHGVIREVQARILDREEALPSTVIFDFSSVRRLGSAMNQGFARLHALGLEHDLNMVLTSLPFEIEERLYASGYVDEDRFGGFKVFQNLDYAMEWAEDRILEAANLLHMEELSLPELLRPVFPDPAHIPYLMKLLQPIRVKGGKDVFHQGDPSDAMYFIQSGRFRVELVIPGGKTLRLKKMGPGAVFGEMGLYTDAPRSATVTAVETGVVYRLSKKRIALIETKLPRLKSSIDRFLVNLLAGRVADANAMARDLMR